jgi:hypothetical protein
VVLARVLRDSSQSVHISRPRMIYTRDIKPHSLIWISKISDISVDEASVSTLNVILSRKYISQRPCYFQL